MSTNKFGEPWTSRGTTLYDANPGWMADCWNLDVAERIKGCVNHLAAHEDLSQVVTVSREVLEEVRNTITELMECGFRYQVWCPENGEADDSVKERASALLERLRALTQPEQP